ncbi:MAG: riboflavin synthase [Myxococcota bacterium]
MFTGLIEDVGRLDRLERQGREARLTVGTSIDMDGVALGDSIAVNGACLTAVAKGDGWFRADVSEETLRRTNLGDLKPGDRVNLERALRVGDRMGGHMVQGHVDGVGRLVERTKVGDGWELTWEIPEDLLDTVVEKGSIALDGVSLTVAHLDGARVTVAVVPHTGEHTNMLDRPIGAPTNVETDLVGKYVRRSLERLGGGGDAGGLSLEALVKAGFA